MFPTPSPGIALEEMDKTCPGLLGQLQTKLAQLQDTPIQIHDMDRLKVELFKVFDAFELAFTAKLEKTADEIKATVKDTVRVDGDTTRAEIKATVKDTVRVDGDTTRAEIKELKQAMADMAKPSPPPLPRFGSRSLPMEVGQNSLFVGRQSILEALCQGFQAGAEPGAVRGRCVQALSGLGGRGKSETAKEYCRWAFTNSW